MFGEKLEGRPTLYHFTLPSIVSLCLATLDLSVDVTVTERWSSSNVMFCSQELTIETSRMETLSPWMAAFSSFQTLNLTVCTLKKWSLPVLEGLQSLSVTCSNLREVSQPESNVQ